jgi:simple sugar transport system permease protein
MGVGILVSFLHALLTVTFKIDQIISGLAINSFVAGTTEFVMHLVWTGTSSRTIVPLPQWIVMEPGPVGDIVNHLFGKPIVIATLLLIPLLWLTISKMRFGLRLRAVGENPAACDTLGISVPGMRYSGVLLSGALAGLGGAWLAFNINQFQHGMSAGKGFIAMAAVVCGKWNPLGAVAACLLFGFSGALASSCERWGVRIPSELIGTLPYLLTMIAVAGFVGRARSPAALGVPYEK